LIGKNICKTHLSAYKIVKIGFYSRYSSIVVLNGYIAKKKKKKRRRKKYGFKVMGY